MTITPEREAEARVELIKILDLLTAAALRALADDREVEVYTLSASADMPNINKE